MSVLKVYLKSVADCRWALPVLIAAAFVFAILEQYFPVLNGYTEFIIITVGINVILCASLNLVNGYMGEFSVGHAGFMSLGAYTSAIITVKFFPHIAELSSKGFPYNMQASFIFFMAVIAGGLVAAFIGFLLALLSFKTRGDYLAIITLAFLMIVKSAFENIHYVGGPRGLLGIHKLTCLPWTFFGILPQPGKSMDGHSSIVWTLFWVVVTLWIIRNLVYSKVGRAIVAIREDEIAANAMGVRTREAKIFAFAVSSFFGGVAGALYAHQIKFINPSSFDILKSTEILIMVYLGGIGSLGGSVLGAVIFTVLSQSLQRFGTWRMVILSMILVLLMLFRPRGIMGLKELTWFIPGREFFTRRKK